MKYMELKDHTEEQLRAELKRRYDEHQKERESMKRCGHCGRTLPESEFYRNKTRGGRS